MAQLNIKLDDRQLRALRSYAAARRTPVSWLIRDYVGHLIAGGAPVGPVNDEPTNEDIARLAEHGGSFDWLAEEPDVYTLEDGEPV